LSRPRGDDGLIVAIDQGTSSVKVLAFDLSGRPVKAVAAPTEVRFSRGDTMEAYPEEWWSQTVQCLRELLGDPYVRPDKIRAVGLCGVMHTVIPVDAHGRAIAAVPLWADQRYRDHPSPAYQAVSSRISEPSSNSCIGRLTWLLDKNPTLKTRVRHLLPVKDFLRYKLSGVAATDHYEAEGTGLCGNHGTQWSSELLDILEIPVDSLPSILRPDSQAGGVTAAAAEATGLTAGTPVIVGTSDWHAALLGSNAFLPTRASLYLGTAGVLGAFRSHRDLGHSEEAVCFGAVTSTGSALDWLAHVIEPGASGRLDVGAQSVSQLAGRSDVGAHGLVFLPHLMGERGGSIRPNATGTLTGLRLNHDRCDIVRAVIEGTAMWLRMITTNALLSERIDALVATGGGARDPLNATIAAAIYQKPVIVPEVTEAGALGVAILAAKGVGIIEDQADAAANWVRSRRVEQPTPELVDRYAEVFDRFVRTEQVVRVLEQAPPTSSVAVA
jgi:xylulokinase